MDEDLSPKARAAAAAAPEPTPSANRLPLAQSSLVSLLAVPVEWLSAARAAAATRQ